MDVCAVCVLSWTMVRRVRRGSLSSELVSLYIGYWTLNNYYYYYVSFGSKVRPRTFGCVAMGVLLFIVRSRLLIYSASCFVWI